jgi:single-stranded-DNA-specific exonuclease
MIPKVWKQMKTDEAAVAKLNNELPIHPVFCKLLIQQGVTSVHQAKKFFYPDLKHLNDPLIMKDMDKAVERLHQAIQGSEKILLYGDYDVDGTTSVAVMFSFLKKLGIHADYYIPDRYKEGYGISFESIDFAAQNQIDLFIAMDCGIKAEKQARAARHSDIDLIICDHHTPGKNLPIATAVLDPKRNDCDYPFKGLSGCGVVFKLIQAYCQKHNLPDNYWQELLDLLVISIAADIVPVNGENRILAHHGLQKLNQTNRPGLKALIDHSKKEYPLNISDVVFGLAPTINAAGRMADAATAVKLMLTNSPENAKEITKALDYRNELRRSFEQRITDEAIEAFTTAEGWEDKKSACLYQEHWHKGVIGIVASRIVEKFYRPTIIFTKSDNRVVGSARSVRGFDILEAITRCEDLLVNFGGHQYAAGLTLLPENVPAFCDRFEGVVQVSLPKHLQSPQININAELKFEDITPKFRRILAKFAPFGPGNRNPVFQTFNVMDTGYSETLKKEHISLSLRQNGTPPFKGIAFFMSEYAEKVYSRAPFDICYNLRENTWQGKSRLQLMVKDMKFGEE